MALVKLTDDELDAVLHAARPLRLQDRDAFLQEVATLLQQSGEVGPGTVFKVCREVQRKFYDPPLEGPTMQSSNINAIDQMPG